MVKALTIRLVFSVIASRSWSIGVLEDTICMTRPNGFVDPPRVWYDTLSCLCSLGSTSDFSLFFRRKTGVLTLVLVYVADIPVSYWGSTEEAMGSVQCFLGIEVFHTAEGFHLCQQKYIC